MTVLLRDFAPTGSVTSVYSRDAVNSHRSQNQFKGHDSLKVETKSRLLIARPRLLDVRYSDQSDDYYWTIFFICAISWPPIWVTYLALPPFTDSMPPLSLEAQYTLCFLCHREYFPQVSLIWRSEDAYFSASQGCRDSTLSKGNVFQILYKSKITIFNL